MDINELASSIGRSVNITRWALDFIEDTLPEYEKIETYGCDLGYLLTETPNNNGVYEDDSIKFIAEHFFDARDEYEYEEDNFGEVLYNPFKKPEAFVVCMLINTVESIIGNCPYIEERWNEEFELTKDVIENILSWVQNFLR